MTDDADAPAPRPPTIEERQRAEYRQAFAAAKEAQELVEPTAEERRNGWDAKSLTEYLTDQRAAASLRIDPKGTMRRRPLPKTANHTYRPHRWRDR